MKIREYEAGDQAHVVALWNACELTRPWNDPIADIGRCLDTPTSTLFVGVEDDTSTIIASVMCGYDGHRAWVYYLAVDPNQQGGGRGRRMMRHAETWLGAQGAVKVMLMIREGNEAVQAFYEQLGYNTEPRINMARWLIRD